MKCHLLVCCLLFATASRAESNVENLEAEHRSAKPEPFLDRLAAFFSGAGNKKDKRPPPLQPQLPHLHTQTAAASVPRPVAVRPPLPPRPHINPPVAPPQIPLRKQHNPVYQSVASSNNFQTFVNPGQGKQRANATDAIPVPA